MASTRSLNLPRDYNLEQKSYKEVQTYRLYENASNGQAFTPAMPSLGYTPSHMARNVFSNNPVDIESSLFGINANNLVDPQKPINPELKQIQFKPFFEVLPLFMPNPFVLEINQRPFPIPN